MKDITTNIEFNKSLSDLVVAQIKLDLLLDQGNTASGDSDYFKSLISDCRSSLNKIMDYINKSE
tara:strand:+ start:513 stop:704 length:192 start_codon:yes stop_codon:yes gene_type:complete